MTFEFGFREQMQMSEGVCEGADVTRILLGNLPGALSVHRAHEVNDRDGTDYWCEHTGGRHLSIDVKARSQDYAEKGFDDLALETWSVVGRKEGWTRDASKRTDYVLWLWEDTGRWCLIPFPMLCTVFAEHWEDWSHTYKTARQRTGGAGGWESECVFVPRKIVWSAVYQRYGGQPDKNVEAA